MKRDEIKEKLKANGLLLAELDQETKEDKELVILAVTENPFSIQFASEALRDDLEVLTAAYKAKSFFREYKNPGGRSIIGYASQEQQNSIDLLLTLLKYDSGLIHHFPRHYLQEEYFMKKAVARNGIVIRFADEKIRYNRDLVLIAAKENGAFLMDNGFNHFLMDREVALNACISNSNVIEYLPDEFKNDKNFVQGVLKNSYVGALMLQHFPRSILKQKDVILDGFVENFDLITFVLVLEENLLHDDELIMEVFKRFPLDKENKLKFLSHLLINFWTKKHPNRKKNLKDALKSKSSLIKRVIEIRPEALPYFEKLVDL